MKEDSTGEERKSWMENLERDVHWSSQQSWLVTYCTGLMSFHQGRVVQSVYKAE